MSSSLQEKLPVRAVALCCDGLFQRYLAGRTAQRMNLVGVVFQKDAGRADRGRSRWRLLLRPMRLVKHLIGRWVIHREQREAADLLEPVRRLPEEQSLFCPTLTVANINDPRTVEFVDRLAPDVVLVNGTRLIRKPLLDRARELPLGMINLHTGLSPYSRGGNCNLHMLREGKPQLVGVTVHHIDPGIDSGDLILTARPDLAPGDTFERIEAKVFLLGIELLLRAVRLLHEGRAPRVPQWDEGKLFLRRTGYVYEPWQRFEVRRALRGGLVRDYLANPAKRDARVRLVDEGESA